MTSNQFTNLSPSPDRTGRACAWIEHDGRVLMTGLEWGGWTLPGGGIHPGETGLQAAIREAWEETGIHAEPLREEPFTIYGRTGIESQCYVLRLVSAEPSPEGRPLLWVNPRSFWWACDTQLSQVLTLQGYKLPPRGIRLMIQRVRPFLFQQAHRRRSRS